MKTTEEIKKGLECSSNCSENINGCKNCPYNGLDCCDLHPDALALIQQLEAQVPRWISVEDHNPTKPGWYQAFQKGHSHPQYLYFRGKTWAVSSSPANKVLFWAEPMPLPQAPKEEAR